MLRLRFVALLLGCGLLLTGCYSGYYSHRPSWAHRVRDSVAVMTNQDVVALTKSGVKESVILNLLKRSQPNFQLGPDDVIALSDSGVSEKVINAMIKAQDNGPEVSSSRSAYDPYYYSWYMGNPYWYWGYAWDPWYYSWYPGTYYHSWYRPHYSYGFYGGYHPSYRSGGGSYGGGVSRGGGRHR